MKNVHEFDGTLKYTPELNFNKEQKDDLFKKLLLRLNHPVSIEMLKLIINQKCENFDNKNNINTTDILADISYKILNNNEIETKFLEEQFFDMFMLGKCPQGRTTRLLQVWNSIKDL